MNYKVSRVGVLGAGTMGAQISGLLASHGIPSDLLDLHSKDGSTSLAEEGKKRLIGLGTRVLGSEKAADLIRPGKLPEHFERLRECDWVIEVISERLDWKKELYENLELLRIWGAASRRTAIFVTHSIREAIFLSDSVAVLSPNPGRLLGVHRVKFPRPRQLNMRDSKEFRKMNFAIEESIEKAILQN